ncbi:MAG: SCP2 sterol-binding domain-containing protein [Deltaproteobacteria bacterium]|nr:SCP2 sterol-binding domain-containing protein [Deltaproteobacteria bacterium]
MKDLNITFAQEAEEIGLASMLADLIRQNVAQKPHKRADFDKLNAVVSIEARDAEVTITLEFRKGSLRVHGGVHGTPDISIATDSETVLQLSLASIVCGLPNFFDEGGRAMLRKMRTGDLKISGMLWNPVQLVRMTRLMSVNG